MNAVQQRAQNKYTESKNPSPAVNENEKVSNQEIPTIKPGTPKKNPYKNPLAERANSPEFKEKQPKVEKEREEEEGFLMSSLRTGAQLLQGFLETTTPGLAASFWQLLGSGETNLDVDELSQLHKIWQREKGEPFPEEEYEKAREQALSMVPTVSNIARTIEQKYGVPLEPKTDFQKTLRFFTNAHRLSPEGATLRPLNVGLPKPVLAGGVVAAEKFLTAIGVPEQIAEPLSFAILKMPQPGSSTVSIGKKEKPSGLTEQRYEKINKPTEVSPKKIKTIENKVESEFRELKDKIIEKSPLKETYSELKENPTFKKESSEAFKEVSKLSEAIPDKFSTFEVKKQIAKDFYQKGSKGITPSEYELAHRKFLRGYLKNTPHKNMNTKQLVEQYRKNNEDLSTLYEPGKSFAYNQAKRNSLVDYNRAISNLIEKKFPDTDFSKLFKSSNEQWAKIMDAEAIDTFIDKMFEGKISFKTGKEFFNKNGMTKPFERSLGKEGFKDFEQLMTDLMSKEQAHKYLMKAENNGWEKLGKTAAAFMIHPVAGKTKFALDTGRFFQRKLFESVMDKPQLAIKWNEGIQSMKKGNYAKAEKAFDEIKTASEKPKEAVKPSEILKEEKIIPEKKVQTIEGKAEKIVKPKDISESEKVSPTEQHQKKETAQNITEAFTEMGSGMMNDFYQGIFDSLEKGKSTFSGIKDPLIAKAKPYYDAGLIKTSSELKKFANNPKIFEEKVNSQVKKPNIKQVEHTPILYKEKIDSGSLKGSNIEIRQKPGMYPDIWLNGEKQAFPKIDSVYQLGLDELHDLYKHGKKYGKFEEANKKSQNIIKKVKESLEKQKTNKEKSSKEPIKIERIERIVKDLGETRGKGQQYHGTGQSFSEINPDHFGEGNIYGQGFYTTDAIDIAQGYSKGKKGDYSAKAPEIFKVTEKRPVKLFDMEKPISEKLKKDLEKSPFDSVHDALADKPKNMREFYDKVRDQAHTNEFQDIAFSIQEIFEDMKYDGLRHKGGEQTKSKPHEVKIYFKPAETLKITPLKSARQMKGGAKTPSQIELDHKTAKTDTPKKVEEKINHAAEKKSIPKSEHEIKMSEKLNQVKEFIKNKELIIEKETKQLSETRNEILKEKNTYGKINASKMKRLKKEEIDREYSIIMHKKTLEKDLFKEKELSGILETYQSMRS